MTQVETVALWVGLVASVAGIVLSIAALVFGVWVNNRATEVNDQTIRSLQKIESAVERLSDDTRNLIKAAWDKMLGDFSEAETPSTDSDETARSVASGLTDEARLELGLTKEGNGRSQHLSPEELQRFDGVLANLKEALTEQLRNTRYSRRPSQVLEALTKKISKLSPNAQSLLAALADSLHLTRRQYQELRKNPKLGASLLELRGRGLIVPLSGTHSDGYEIPVYWLPGDIADRVKAALQLLPDLPKDLRTIASEELAGVRRRYPE